MDAAVAKNNMKTPRAPLSDRITVRMIVVAGVFLFLIGYPVYMYVDATLNQGVKRMGDVAQVDLKALGNFPFDEMNGTINDVPKQYRELDGKRVVLQGYPYTTKYAGEEAPEFEFVYNVANCCFGGPPKVQERVFARAKPGKTAPLYNMQFAQLEGTLHVRVEKEEGHAKSLFTLDIDRISLIQ